MQKVTFYPYRTAIVFNPFMTQPREACRGLEIQLAADAKVEPDNHTVYKVVHQNDSGVDVTYIWFTDTHVYFGRSIKEVRF